MANLEINNANTVQCLGLMSAFQAAGKSDATNADIQKVDAACRQPITNLLGPDHSALTSWGKLVHSGYRFGSTRMCGQGIEDGDTSHTYAALFIGHNIERDTRVCEVSFTFGGAVPRQSSNNNPTGVSLVPNPCKTVSFTEIKIESNNPNNIKVKAMEFNMGSCVSSKGDCLYDDYKPESLANALATYATTGNSLENSIFYFSTSGVNLIQYPNGGVQIITGIGQGSLADNMLAGGSCNNILPLTSISLASDTCAGEVGQDAAGMLRRAAAPPASSSCVPLPGTVDAEFAEVEVSFDSGGPR